MEESLGFLQSALERGLLPLSVLWLTGLFDSFGPTLESILLEDTFPFEILCVCINISSWQRVFQCMSVLQAILPPVEPSLLGQGPRE